MTVVKPVPTPLLLAAVLLAIGVLIAFLLGAPRPSTGPAVSPASDDGLAALASRATLLRTEPATSSEPEAIPSPDRISDRPAPVVEGDAALFPAWLVVGDEIRYLPTPNVALDLAEEQLRQTVLFLSSRGLFFELDEPGPDGAFFAGALERRIVEWQGPRASRMLKFSEPPSRLSCWLGGYRLPLAASQILEQEHGTRFVVGRASRRARDGWTFDRLRPNAGDGSRMVRISARDRTTNLGPVLGDSPRPFSVDTELIYSSADLFNSGGEAVNSALRPNVPDPVAAVYIEHRTGANRHLDLLLRGSHVLYLRNRPPRGYSEMRREVTVESVPSVFDFSERDLAATGLARVELISEGEILEADIVARARTLGPMGTVYAYSHDYWPSTQQLILGSLNAPSQVCLYVALANSPLAGILQFQVGSPGVLDARLELLPARQVSLAGLGLGARVELISPTGEAYLWRDLEWGVWLDLKVPRGCGLAFSTEDWRSATWTPDPDEPDYYLLLPDRVLATDGQAEQGPGSSWQHETLKGF